ncbi:MAG: helix-turn-helix domain-containing protein [Synergistaceae bacterium]|jgi:xylan 1,4-beta-xylosidase|nr:helix-turn-helix domain-containing protein [Synergistaceae bacterium]
MQSERFDLTLGSTGAYYRSLVRGIEVFMVLKGTMTLELNGLCYVLEPDDLALVNDMDIYSIYATAPNIVLSLKLFPAFFERECPEILHYRYCCNSTSLGENPLEKAKFFDAKRSLIRMMLARCRQEDGDELEVGCALMDLLRNVYTNFRAAPAKTKSARDAPKDAGNIQAALSYIHENYRAAVGLTDAAASASMSPQYFSRLFKQKMGVGFLEYLNGLRLDSAVRELLETNQSILKIAVNNGFAGSKPFTILFKKNYGQTPRSYRLGEAGACAEKAGDSSPFNSLFSGIRKRKPVGDRENLGDLLKYVALYDIQHGSRVKSSESMSFSLLSNGKMNGKMNEKTNGKNILSLPRKMFKIGKLAEALDDRLRNQLRIVQRRLDGDYVYFQGIFEDGVPSRLGDSFFKGYDYGRIFNFFMELGLTPFVRVDLSLAPPTMKSSMESSMKSSMKSAVSDFMNALLENALLARWKRRICFEAVHSETMESSAFASRFCELRRELKAFSPSVEVGFHSVSSSRPEEWTRLRENLMGCKEEGCAPDFLSITIDPALEEDGTAFGPSFWSAGIYGVSQIEKVRRVSAECGAAPAELYVTEWNTLSGRTSIESSTFFRAALIAADLLSYGDNGEGGEHVSAVAYWLNSGSKELSTGKVDNRVLALFFGGRVRRPPYYLLYMMSKLGKNVACRNEKVVVTAVGPGEYAVLIVNPCYFDPRYSVEDAYVAMESVRIEVHLADIPKGRYRFKVFFFEKQHSSVFDRWCKLGILNLNDEDAADYLERAALPELNIFEEDIDSVYTFAPELGYNGVALYLFRKISPEPRS